MNKNTITLLNISRWGAAFLVVLAHAKSLILVDFENVIHPSLLIKVFYLMAGVGHEAVVVFFVISGFLVGGVTFKKWTSQGPTVLEYAIHRFSRIYIVLIPALLLGGFIDWIGLNWFNNSQIYTETNTLSIGSMHYLISEQLSFKVFVQNIFMLEHIFAPIFGSNGPLWSLAYEWWYYLLFAMLCLAYINTGLKRYALVIGVIAIGFLLPTKLLLMMSIWALGFVLYLVYDKVSIPQKPIMFALIFFMSMAICRIIRTGETEFEPIGVLRDFCLGITYCLLLLSVNKKKLKWKPSKLHQYFAEFSYSLYLTHYPMMVLFVALNYQLFNLNFRLQPSFLSMTYVITAIPIAYLYAYIFSKATESHTASIKDFLYRTLTAKFFRSDCKQSIEKK